MSAVRPASRNRPPGPGPRGAATRSPGADLAAAVQAYSAFAPLLDALQDALRSAEPAAVQQATQQLQSGLAPLQAGLLAAGPQALAMQRAELARMAAQIQAQRQAVARAQAAAARRAEVLLPAAAGGYGAQGQGDRAASSGAAQA